MKKRSVYTIGKRIAAQAIAALCLAGCMGSVLQAEEGSGYYDEAGYWFEDTGSYSSTSDDYSQESAGTGSADALAALADGAMQDSALTGIYSVEEGWSVDADASTDEETVYKKDDCVGVENTSTITCSYMDTNYSVLEYEQLRDMLTNNLLYSNVNAQISTSAIYTQEKDYLYIVIVDDSALEYKDVYHYVVGDYRCFCVEVREYRAEADQDVADDVKTPHEVGQKTAEEFTWGVA